MHRHWIIYFPQFLLLALRTYCQTFFWIRLIYFCPYFAFVTLIYVDWHNTIIISGFLQHYKWINLVFTVQFSGVGTLMSDVLAGNYPPPVCHACVARGFLFSHGVLCAILVLASLNHNNIAWLRPCLQSKCGYHTQKTLTLKYYVLQLQRIKNN